MSVDNNVSYKCGQQRECLDNSLIYQFVDNGVIYECVVNDVSYKFVDNDVI